MIPPALSMSKGQLEFAHHELQPDRPRPRARARGQHQSEQASFQEAIATKTVVASTPLRATGNTTRAIAAIRV